MTNNKQSSVEWYRQEIMKILFDSSDNTLIYEIDIFNKAEAMRKDEIKNAQMDMFIHLNNLPYGLEYLEKRQSAEDFSQQYYKEKFGGYNE
jgi:hypothetical protein